MRLLVTARLLETFVSVVFPTFLTVATLLIFEFLRITGRIEQ